jgi:DNA-binding LytR/AlgR family response regulator
MEAFFLHTTTTKYKNSNPDLHLQLQLLTNIIQQTQHHKIFKKQFTIHQNKNIYFLETNNILLFKADDGVLFAIDEKGKKHLLSETSLTEIENQLNPDAFFRINRGELIQKSHIERVERYNKNALAIKLKGYNPYLKTSQSQTALFREWLEK